LDVVRAGNELGVSDDLPMRPGTGWAD